MVIILLALLLASQEIGLKDPLELKAYLDAPSPWFPNQEGKILYRISYRGKIQLTVEDLPLLDPQEFEKVGDKIIENRDELDYSVQDIYQKVKPIKGGSFTLPASHVEGFIYEIRGGKVVPLQKVESSLPPFKVEVTAFPAEGKPSLFNGSVGSFDFSLSRIGTGTTQIGDWITLELAAKGENFSGLKFPSIGCLPGIAGFFRLDDLPVQVQQEEGSRKYTFRLAPLIAGIEEIPPIAWPIFDPITHKYSTWESESIPLIPAELPSTTALTYPSKPLPDLSLPDIQGSKEMFDKGEIPLTLLVLERQWRKNPWSFTIRRAIHDIQERAGLPFSPFPAYSFFLTLLTWLLLPFTLLALWRRSIFLLSVAAAFALFLLSPWGKEEKGIILHSTLIKEGNGALFLAGEVVTIHSKTEASALVSSERLIGEVPLDKIVPL